MGLFPGWNSNMDASYLRAKVGTILGGVPTHNDFKPSLVFTILYILLLIPLFFRLWNQSLSFKRLWKLLLIIILNISAYSIRVKLSEGRDWSKDLFVAEMMLLRLTPILQTSALISLFQDALVPYLPLADSSNLLFDLLLRHFVSLLQACAYFCLALTIAVAFDVKQAINGSPEARVKLHISKQVSIYMLMAINIALYLLFVVPVVMLWKGHFNQDLVLARKKEVSKFSCLSAVGTFLLIIAGYKTAQLVSSGLHTRVDVIINWKSLFYGICVSSEYVVSVLLVMLPWNNIVPLRPALDLYVISKRRLKGESSGSSPSSAEDGQQPSHFDYGHQAYHCSTYPQSAPYSHPTTLRQGGEEYVSKFRECEDFDMSSCVSVEAPYLVSNLKRGSAQSLSTISEVRPSQARIDVATAASMTMTTGRRGRSASCDLPRNVRKIQHVRPPCVSMPARLGSHPDDGPFRPPPSATESVRSHWSDDSEDDKKGGNGLFTLVRNTRDSLGRKNSKGSRKASK